MHGGLSTGPRTAEGKARCRAAALRNLEAAQAALARKRAGLGGSGDASAGEKPGENTEPVGPPGSTESTSVVDVGDRPTIHHDADEAITALQLGEAVQLGPHVLRTVAVGRNGVQAIEPRDVGALVRLQSGEAMLIVWPVVTWAELERPIAPTGQGSEGRS